jgi:hypothetical protein
MCQGNHSDVLVDTQALQLSCHVAVDLLSYMSTNKLIGSTKMLIPVASTISAPEHLLDGGTGDIEFPNGTFKVLAAIGEDDKKTGKSLTVYLDDAAAYFSVS